MASAIHQSLLNSHSPCAPWIPEAGGNIRSSSYGAPTKPIKPRQSDGGVRLPRLRSRRDLLRFWRILLVRPFQRITWNKLMKGNNLSGACSGRQMGEKLGHACMVRHTHTGRIFLESPQGILQATSSPILLSIAQKPGSGMPTNKDRNFRLCFVAQFDGTRRALEIEPASLFGRLQLSCDGTTNLVHDNNWKPLQCLP
jgi:hypothetical protein